MDKLYNDIAIDQLAELEYALRDGLVIKERAEEAINLCQNIINLIMDQN